MSELPDLENYFDWDGLEWQDYKKDLADWFKRCISDYPRGAYKDIEYERIDWFEKWFSQFKEKGEDG